MEDVTIQKPWIDIHFRGPKVAKLVSCIRFCTRMSSVFHSYVLVCHPYVSRMYSYVIRVSLVCTRMSSACHSYVLACHSYVTHMYSYVIRMSLVSGFTIPFTCCHIRMTYEYIRVTYEWHTSTYEWHTNDLRVTYGWHAIRKKNKVIFFKAVW